MKLSEACAQAARELDVPVETIEAALAETSMKYPGAATLELPPERAAMLVRFIKFTMIQILRDPAKRAQLARAGTQSTKSK